MSSDAGPWNDRVVAVDLFCGGGGMTCGLRQAGIRVIAGIDNDPIARYAFVSNNPGSEFFCRDLATMDADEVGKLFDAGKIRLVAGCAPCQPFSSINLSRGPHPSKDMLDHFRRIVTGVLPELVVMENVPGLAGRRGRGIFNRFVSILQACGYQIDWRVVSCADYGVPQARRRLILLASRIGDIRIPVGRFSGREQWRTVRQAIGNLPPLQAGEACASDPMHAASRMSLLNMERIRATPRNGGGRMSWPKELWLNAHLKSDKSLFADSYGRMSWDKPSPVVRASFRYSEGRFGHPDQDRGITCREAARLQTFPDNYCFWPPDQKMNIEAVSRMIGNAVPPLLAKELGQAIVEHVTNCNR